MTAKLKTRRDERARDALEAVIREALRSRQVAGISVSAHDNHTGEPALYVYVTMGSEAEIPDILLQNKLMQKMISALEQVEDDRFPYLHFGPREQSLDPQDDDEF